MALHSKSSIHRILAVTGLATAFALGGLALPAFALDDIAIGAKAETTGGCPELTRIKYPWITCVANAHGGVALRVPGQPQPATCNLRRINGDCAADGRLSEYGPEFGARPR